MSTLDEYYQKRHQMIELPCARVQTPKAGGSGTIIYSRKNGNGGYSTFAVTNHHVVENCIKLEDQWSTLLKASKKIDAFEQVDVHLFKYKWESRAIGGTTVQSDIVGYDKTEDLALLKLRTDEPAKAVAKLYPRKEESWLRVGMPVITVGAGLGAPPVQTFGFLSQFGQEIDRREFWLNTAPSIFGNSGGAMFLGDVGEMFPNDELAEQRQYTLLGVPARIAVALLGFSADAITHLSYAIPMTRIYNFLEEQRFRFIYDDEFTEEGEEEERERIREEQERKLAGKS